MEERTITPMRKITDSSLKLRRMDFGKRREKNMLAAKEKSTPFCRLESLETESDSDGKIAPVAFTIRSLPLPVL
ncbi:MAG: hypothetical protein DMF74_14640 [Acidobacteria bacterium]|nr:MAG: hypothetical protein DMF74_14640 [Acidobacteriota bacterium]